MDNLTAIGNSEPTPDNLPDEIKKIINDGKREAGFNPDGTPMSNPTNTNQASEDELRESIDALLEQVIHIGYVQGYNQLAQMAGVAPYNHIQPLEPEEAKTAIQELIRTEKLKLLAEVRERVVGEDLSHRSLGTKLRGVIYNTQIDSVNILKEEQREELTKLEAEL